ncbi:MAG: hypothetical protein NC821_04660 [Candidatus Omnitrophica bacterium]|nr:hypothetical protein [Candidatus Omnitrophota bacterium]
MRESLSLKNILAIALWFTAIFSIWNISNYLALKQNFSFIKVEDLTLFPALIILSAYSLYSDKGLFSANKLWLALLAFSITVLGLRGGIYALLQPIPPMTIWEIRNYALAGALSLIGLAYALKNIYLKAYASASISLTLFAFLWGLTPIGFTLLIKSLHYFGLLLALGAGFFIQKLLKKPFGKILAFLFRPFVFFLGVPREDIGVVAQVLGERTILTELVSYRHLAELIIEKKIVHFRSVVIVSYALCGFAHIASLAIFTGGIISLAPKRTKDVALLGLRSLFSATLACLLTAAIAGIFFQENKTLLFLNQ